MDIRRSPKGWGGHELQLILHNANNHVIFNYQTILGQRMKRFKENCFRKMGLKEWLSTTGIKETENMLICYNYVEVGVTWIQKYNKDLILTWIGAE